MSWPNWMEDEVLRWLITGIGIGILSIIVTVVLKFWPTHPSKKQLPTLLFFTQYILNYINTFKESFVTSFHDCN